LEEIGKIAKEHGILFHTDAVQAFGHIPLDVEKLQVDMLSASAHKIHGPKGVGILYIRRNVKLGSFIHGGAQEKHRRAGTHNVPAIVGMGEAAGLAAERMEESVRRESELRDYLIEKVLAQVTGSVLTGGRDKRLPNNASFCFAGIEGESLLILLSQQGICGSGGSACSTGAVDPSHVLEAIGVAKELAKGALRLTVSSKTTKEELDEAVAAIQSNVEKLRSMRI
jgi:cysteine desulfurase